MPIPETYEEVLAKRINPRNYSEVLQTIYTLRMRQDEEYIPKAFDRIIYSSLPVGASSASATFSSLSNTSFSRGTEIPLSGIATYKIVSGPTVLETKAAIKLIAQIDIGRSGPPRSLPAYQVECAASQINSDGSFSFVIPSQITSALSKGSHYIYIDAFSPDNPPVRLPAAGANNDERQFTIT